MTAEQPQVRWHARDVDTTSLEAELTSLWKRLRSEAPEMHPVLTRVFNLIAFAADRAEADSILASLHGLRRLHPSRTIVLVNRRLDRTVGVDADASVLCDTGDDGISACHERVVLEVRGRAADHLASAVAPLLVPDLPTFLWWPGQPLFGHRIFQRLLDVASHLVVDSAQFDDPSDSLADLARVASGRHAVNDINWARLTPWRDAIAQFFDNPRHAPYARSITNLQLEFGSGEGSKRATAGCLLLLGWMSDLLRWEPETTLDGALAGDVALAVLQDERVIPIQVRFRDHGAGAACRLMALTIRAAGRDKPEAQFSVRLSRDRQHLHAEVSVIDGGSVGRVVPMGMPEDIQLLADELEVIGRDSLYDTVVWSASRLAGREV